ncbi:MAG: IS256 family transposase [Eubacterium sp.]|nr:IS256 family transposase [Eubacterium sp.]
MASKKKEVYKVKPLNENKRNIISALIEEYDIETADDIQEALRDLLGGTIKSMMEVEMEEHLGYENYQRHDSDNYRNGTKSKTVRSNFGEFEIDVPQDRNSTFEPKVVQKRQKDISEIDKKIISMYARGLTTRQISEQIEEIYGFECSEGFISNVTDKILGEIDDWQKRPLDSVYPILYIDAVHFSVREDNIIKKLAAYVIMGINADGFKDVLSIQIGENESSKFWLGSLNELKNRGVKDVMVICADGLTGIKQAIEAAFPMAEYQRCIVHMVRNTLKHVYYKDMKSFAADLKTIYLASSEEIAMENLKEVTEKWSGKYPAAMKRWEDNWDVITPIFKFSSDVRKVIYTTNAIESLNSTYKKLNRQRSVFPSDKALMKSLYLSTLQVTKKWTQAIRNWSKVYNEFCIMYPGRMPGSN